jgi:uncharacterized repeat protein (TIGR03803 family)
MRPKTRMSTPIQLVTLFAVTLMFAPGLSAISKYKVLYAFKAGTDGNSPSGALLFDTAGNLYGTTVNGGSNGTCLYGQGVGCGIVFELTPGQSDKWTESVLYRFQGGSDGGNPNGSLIFDTAGNLYGTTLQGGTGIFYGCGTIFQLTPGSSGWSESVIYTFCSQSGAYDGFSPSPGLIQDKLGNFYGTTESGGNGGGVAFELTPGSGGPIETVLHSFCQVGSCSSSGSEPVAGLVRDAAGNLYGTTLMGGNQSNSCGGFPGGCGVVFRLTPSRGGWTESVLHKFIGPEGVQPASNLTFDKQGNLYGTTGINGAFGFGTVFKLTPGLRGGWKYAVLYNFRSGTKEESFNTGVILDAAGNLYGASTFGGIGSCSITGCGLVYKLTPGPHGRWTYSALHKFSGGGDGGEPGGGVILDKEGHIFGTTRVGGVGGNGVVFEITP